jgi:hypothetical protein
MYDWKNHYSSLLDENIIDNNFNTVNVYSFHIDTGNWYEPFYELDLY